MTPDSGADGPVFPDLGAIFSQFERANERLESAAAEASRTIVEGHAADGAVRIRMTGDSDPLSVAIDPDVVAQGDVSLLEDLVLAALRDALNQVADLQAQVADAAAAPTVDLSSLGGLLGGMSAGEPGGGGGILGNLSEVLGGLGLGKSDTGSDTQAEGDSGAPSPDRDSGEDHSGDASGGPP